jgi:hypothetical protein
MDYFDKKRGGFTNDVAQNVEEARNKSVIGEIQALCAGNAVWVCSDMVSILRTHRTAKILYVFTAG